MAFIYLASVFYLAESTVTEFSLSSWDHQFGKYFTLTVYKDSYFGWLHCTLSEINGCSSDRYFQLDFHVTKLSSHCNGYLLGWHKTRRSNYIIGEGPIQIYSFFGADVYTATFVHFWNLQFQPNIFQSISLLLSVQMFHILKLNYSMF